MDLDDLAKDFQEDSAQKQQYNQFGQSINKDILQQSKKEIASELHHSDTDAKPKKTGGLQIEIDDGEDFKE